MNTMPIEQRDPDEIWVEDVVNAVSMLQGGSLMFADDDDSDPGQMGDSEPDSDPSQPHGPDMNPPHPQEMPAPQSPQPEIEPYEPSPVADPMSPSAPTA